jgi:hypothetical protein
VRSEIPCRRFRSVRQALVQSQDGNAALRGSARSGSIIGTFQGRRDPRNPSFFSSRGAGYPGGLALPGSRLMSAVIPEVAVPPPEPAPDRSISQPAGTDESAARPRQRTWRLYSEPHGRRETALRRHVGRAVGPAAACSGCRWFSEPKPGWGQTCQDLGVPANGHPCSRDRHRLGHYRPKAIPGQVASVPLDGLGLDGLLLLRFRITEREIQIRRQAHRHLVEGRVVKVAVGNEFVEGVVERVGARVAVVRISAFDRIRVRADEVVPVADTRASELRSPDALSVSPGSRLSDLQGR